MDAWSVEWIFLPIPPSCLPVFNGRGPPLNTVSRCMFHDLVISSDSIMSAPQDVVRQRDRVLDRRDIEAWIAEGKKIVIVDGDVIKADAWLPYHPGGDKAILHMVGRDATNEVYAFHSVETLESMKRYTVGRVNGPWTDFVPPIQGGSFRLSSEIATHECINVDNEDIDSAHGSSQGSSGQSSPLFEPADFNTSRVRKRANGDGTISKSSSATSMSTLAIEPSETAKTSILSSDAKTEQDIKRDLEIYPGLDARTQSHINERYRELERQIRDEGLYECNYKAYGVEMIRYVTLALVAFYLLRTGWYFLSAISLGILWHQLVFTVHDAGHIGITHDFQIDSCIGIFIADFIGGLSCCWWKRNHNVHHIVTNSAEHDPDIQHMPFFAVSHRFFDNLRSSYYDRIMSYDAVARFALRYQHWLYYPILTLGRFNLYVLSWQYIFLGQGPRKGPAWWHRYLEMAGQAFFWYWFGYLVLYRSIPSGWERFMYLMVSHAVTMPVHVQITLSHFAMSTADLGVAESFPQRMLRTTMDVDCPEWLDFIHGGLQFQAVHHLFPRIPRHNLRRCQKLVMQFCREVGIPYALYGFAEGNQKVIGHLGEIAQQARVLAECQKSIAVADVFNHH